MKTFILISVSIVILSGCKWGLDSGDFGKTGPLDRDIGIRKYTGAVTVQLNSGKPCPKAMVDVRNTMQSCQRDFYADSTGMILYTYIEHNFDQFSFLETDITVYMDYTDQSINQGCTAIVEFGDEWSGKYDLLVVTFPDSLTP